MGSDVMHLSEKIEIFDELGNRLKKAPKDDGFMEFLDDVYAANPWFTAENVRFAINAIANMLDKANLMKWLTNYPDIHQQEKMEKIGVVLAGNIPLVGFHDLLCVLLSGNIFIGKLSSKDELLTSFIVQKLKSINAEIAGRLFLTTGRLSGFKAVIATGSNNSSRYFEYYFGKYPHIIRHNRNSVVVLAGDETNKDLELLADDIFRYFGLGCRSVSKIFVPQDFEIKSLFPHFDKYNHIKNHYKYSNNYDYSKAILLINKTPHFDSGFALFKEDAMYASAVSVIHYERYSEKQIIIDRLKADQSEIQCIVSKPDFLSAEMRTVNFGETQTPTLEDYADNVDTMKFLLALD